MYRYSSLILLALTACGNPDPDYAYTTQDGIDIHCHSYALCYSEAETTLASGALVTQCGGRSVLDGLIVHLFPHAFELETHMVGGYYMNSTGLAYVMSPPDDGCIANTSFVHELTHAVLDRKFDIYDPKHLDRIWKCSVNANHDIREELCND